MPTVTITVVQAPACHLCADAREALDEFGGEFPIHVDLTTADGDAGRALLEAHRPALLPLVLVDGAFFSQGRLPRRKLRALLAARTAVGVS